MARAGRSVGPERRRDRYIKPKAGGATTTAKAQEGNKLSLICIMPGLGVDVVVTSADQRVVRFNADARALRALSSALAAAAEVAEGAAQA